MEFVTTAMSAQQQGIKPSPELGRLKAAAERIGRATNNVENFLVRFHGPMPEGGELAKTISDNYRNDLDAVFSAPDRLEVAVNSLEHIG